MRAIRSMVLHSRTGRLLAFVTLIAASLSASANDTLSAHLSPTEPVDFALPDPAGRKLKLSDYRGKWVVVNFWATWCGPCVREMPVLQQFAQSHSDDATVVGVNFEEIDLPTLSSAVKTLGVTYPVVQAGAKPLIPFEPLKGLPSTFIVSPDGALVYRHTGELNASALNDAFTEALRRHADR